MNGKPAKLLALILLAALGAADLQAEEQRSAREARPSYPRNRAERPDTPEPVRKPLPDSLRIAVPRGVTDHPGRGVSGGAARTRRGGDDPPSEEDLESRARQAAAWAAAQAIERHGRLRYFEIGFHEGLHEAFRRSRRDRWEFRQGENDGRFDFEARRLGEEIGYEEARLQAAEEARQAVIDQFAELGREPLPLPSPPPPPFAAAALTVVEPELRDLFRDISWRGKRAAGFRDLRLDPWRLYRAGRHADFYDPGWSTARFGLDLWHKRHRKQAWVRQLSRDDRNAFEAWFETFFEAELARRFAGVADRAFDRGYDAGWRYGTRVGREWQYRRGYHAGFERGVQDSAREVFYSSFQPSWAAAYNALFREWSTTVKLETRASRLGDENDDGVFEPGEELFVELELANLGGGSGRFEAQLTGSVLTGSSQTTIDLPPRSVADQPTRLRGRISPLAVPMSDSLLTVTVGELAETLPVRVSHILLFEGGPELSAHDALLGTAVVEVTLSNTSRQAVRATLEATLPKGLIVNPRRELTRIPPGATRTLRFEIEELPALDLLAGNIVFTVASETGGRPQGRLEGRLPELATDLSDGSMVAYTLRLARSPATDKVEVRRAHELMLRRLEADWQRAVRADGNPYKRDLRGGTRSTALGELVASVQAESGRLVNHAVFTDLVPRIDRLSRSLPGSHPFLRRSMRKLGRKLL